MTCTAQRFRACWLTCARRCLIFLQVTLDDMNSTGWTDKVYCIQYHELIMELCGCWAGNISRIVNVLALVGLGVAQVIASSSNLHALNSRYSKRWALQWFWVQPGVSRA